MDSHRDSRWIDLDSVEGATLTMAKFLNTSATNYRLEELIKEAREYLYIISPFLRLNDRIKELLTDKDRMKIEVRIVYGKSELAPQEINWLSSLDFIRTSFCQNLHAKCYLSEREAIITSMNLYEFSQQNNNEMGVHMERGNDSYLYSDTYEEVQRLFRISEQVRLTAEKVEEPVRQQQESSPKGKKSKPERGYEKLTTSKLAKAKGVRTAELNAALLAAGYLERDEDQLKLTEHGSNVGGEFRLSKKYGPFFLWPKDMEIDIADTASS